MKVINFEREREDFYLDRNNFRGDETSLIYIKTYLKEAEYKAKFIKALKAKNKLSKSSQKDNVRKLK